MMEKSIPAIIMLAAGVTACISCIAFDMDLLTTLKIVLAVLLIFYIIGRIVLKIIAKINKEADEAYEALAEEQERIRLEEELRQQEIMGNDTNAPQSIDNNI